MKQGLSLQLYNKIVNEQYQPSTTIELSAIKSLGPKKQIEIMKLLVDKIPFNYLINYHTPNSKIWINKINMYFDLCPNWLMYVDQRTFIYRVRSHLLKNHFNQIKYTFDWFLMCDTSWKFILREISNQSLHHLFSFLFENKDDLNQDTIDQYILMAELDNN